MEVKNYINDLAEGSEALNNRKNSILQSSRNNTFKDMLSKVIMGQDKAIDSSHKDSNAADVDISFCLEKFTNDFNAVRDNSLKARADSAVGRLATQFGMSKELMGFLLDNMGIKPEDLLDPGMKEKIMNKLSSFLLNDKSKDDVSKLLDSFYTNN
jgi:polyphosphate kinase